MVVSRLRPAPCTSRDQGALNPVILQAVCWANSAADSTHVLPLPNNPHQGPHSSKLSLSLERAGTHVTHRFVIISRIAPKSEIRPRIYEVTAMQQRRRFDRRFEDGFKQRVILNDFKITAKARPTTTPAGWRLSAACWPARARPAFWRTPMASRRCRA